MHPYLEEPITVQFEKLYLDPNNPRLGTPAPGYDDLKILFDETKQQEIHNLITNIYPDVDGLKRAILAQGWTPIDNILVWHHPKNKDHFVVVEGNTRKTALREIREDLKRLKTKLSKLVKEKADKEVIQRTQDEIELHEAVVKVTDKMLVLPVRARDTAELEVVIPKILGVRHIKHPQQWKPYPQNLYLLHLYEKRFEHSHPGAKLFIEDDLIGEIAALVSQSPQETRRGIQSACAFKRFCQRWEDKLPPNEEFSTEDHYFFTQILDNKHAKSQFRFGDDKLELEPEMEDVLFKWAFSKPRKGKNTNVLYKAENIRLWHKMSQEDVKEKTGFATRLDVTNPDTAPTFYELEAQYLSYKAEKAPTKILDRLIAELGKVPAETLLQGSQHLRMQLDHIIAVATKCKQMIESVEKNTSKSK